MEDASLYLLTITSHYKSGTHDQWFNIWLLSLVIKGSVNTEVCSPVSFVQCTCICRPDNQNIWTTWKLLKSQNFTKGKPRDVRIFIPSSELRLVQTDIFKKIQHTLLIFLQLFETSCFNYTNNSRRMQILRFFIM